MCVWLFATPPTVALHVAPLSMGFSQQEYWNGLPFLPPADLPSKEIKLKFLASPALAGRFFTNEPPEFVPNSIVVDLLFGLRADSWILLLLDSICCNILFWLKYMRKSWLHTVGEERYFYSFSDNFSSVQFSHSVMSDSLRPHEPQHSRPPCPSPTPGVHPNPCPLSRWCHPNISSSVVPFPPAPNPSKHQSLFKWVSSSHQVAKVLEFQLQHKSFQWTPRTDIF